MENGVKKTYLGEFCAHEDEENQSQELARRLHLLPPVCGPAVSHADRVPSRPPAQQSVPPGSLSALQVARFLKIIILSLSNPVAESDRSVSRNRFCAYSFHIGSLYSVPLPSVFVAALIYRCDGL